MRLHYNHIAALSALYLPISDLIHYCHDYRSYRYVRCCSVSPLRVLRFSRISIIPTLLHTH